MKDDEIIEKILNDHNNHSENEEILNEYNSQNRNEDILNNHNNENENKDIKTNSLNLFFSQDKVIQLYSKKGEINFCTKDFEITKKMWKTSRRFQNTIFILCIVIIILLLLFRGIDTWFLSGPYGFTPGITATVDTPTNDYDIPGNDPLSVPIPDGDKTTELNEKLDEGKMNINMSSSITFKNGYSTGYLGIKNSEANNFSQFVTITVKSNNTVIYTSGLIAPGNCIYYDQLDLMLSEGKYDCIATFTQVTDDGEICGQASAEVKITVQE